MSASGTRHFVCWTPGRASPVLWLVELWNQHTLGVEGKMRYYGTNDSMQDNCIPFLDNKHPDFEQLRKNNNDRKLGLTFSFPGSWDLRGYRLNLSAVSAKGLLAQLRQSPYLCSYAILPGEGFLKVMLWKLDLWPQNLPEEGSQRMGVLLGCCWPPTHSVADQPSYYPLPTCHGSRKRIQHCRITWTLLFISVW